MRMKQNLRLLRGSLVVIAFILLFWIIQYHYYTGNIIERSISILNLSQKHTFGHHVEDNFEIDPYDVRKVLNNSDNWLFSRVKSNYRNPIDQNSWLRKKRICVLSIDTRPLERFSVIKNFDNMSFHSVAAYNSLFYGKSYSEHERFSMNFLISSDATWIRL